MTGSGERIDVGSARPSGIGDLLVSSRSLEEYRAMFGLTDGDLGRRILDCPGGGPGFTAEASAAGADVVACDPVYGADADRLVSRVEADLHRAGDYVRCHPDEYQWTFFEGPADYAARRAASAALFAQDLRTHRERYVEASLPVLPFADGAFDLVLSSHFLFAYADRFDLAFHLASIVEMARVSTGDVRVYPVFSMGSGPLLDLAPLRSTLADHGVVTRLDEVGYQFQRGEPLTLVCRGAH